MRLSPPEWVQFLYERDFRELLCLSHHEKTQQGDGHQ